MTTQGSEVAGSSAASEAARAWAETRASADIQFAPLPPIQPIRTPGWLKLLDEWLRWLFEPVGRALGLSWPVIEKVLIALAVLGAVFLIWRLVAQPLLRRRPKAEAAEDWAPGRAHAAALLADADRLAAEGRFGEAAHLLLQRSVHHIAEARPAWLHPASTAREIAALPLLPERARAAFAVIAARVERSLFALRDLDAADWQAARSAYTDFALQEFPVKAAPV